MTVVEGSGGWYTLRKWVSVGCAEVSLLLLHAEEHLCSVEALGFSFVWGSDSFSP